jgi:rhodanese-related sulfurtransferase
MPGPIKINDLSPADVSAMLDNGRIVLIDVREPQEYAAGRIHGALNFPLSTFDPKAVPMPADRTVVLQCGTGKRSAMAIERCQKEGLKVDSHLAGGIAAWRAAGLRTTVFDPATQAASGVQ